MNATPQEWLNHIDWVREGKRGKDHPHWRSVEVPCDNCGKPITRTPSKLKKNKHHFCSKPCYGEFKKKNNTICGKNNPMYGKSPWNKGLTKETDERVLKYSLNIKANHPSKTHPNQGEKISKALKEAFAKGEIQIWSKGLTKEEDIRLKRLSEKLSKKLQGTGCGEDNNNWKGGYEPYYGSNWREQREKALKRDGYKCRICGMTKEENNRTPDVHHIIPVRLFDREEYTEANKLSNLITLCKSCHGKYENGYQNKFIELVATI